jgi:hypothetical protein
MLRAALAGRVAFRPAVELGHHPEGVAAFGQERPLCVLLFP